MGAIDRFNIKELKEKYNLVDYIETGTGIGECLDHALQFNFRRYYSIEIHSPTFNKAVAKYQDKNNVYLINDNSENGLKNILAKPNTPSLFWLDAHFPGADFGFASYNSTEDKNLRIPLEKEIETLMLFPFIKESVIIIDDLRIYEDGPFEKGNWDRREELGANGIDFLNVFSDTHFIEKDYRDQGYIILRPK